MSFLGNLIWFILGGLFIALAWFLFGLLLCITIIGIPLGIQFFKLSFFVLFPFGKEVQTNFDKYPILNLIWIILFGWEMAIGHLILGILFCITIIGIPFGKQWFKLTSLALIPFGVQIR